VILLIIPLKAHGVGEDFQVGRSFMNSFAPINIRPEHIIVHLLNSSSSGKTKESYEERFNHTRNHRARQLNEIERKCELMWWENQFYSAFCLPSSQAISISPTTPLKGCDCHSLRLSSGGPPIVTASGGPSSPFTRPHAVQGCPSKSLEEERQGLDWRRVRELICN
jgi:hypothetical protein